MLIPKKFFLGRSFRIHPHLQSYVRTDAHGIVGTHPNNRVGYCMGVVKGDDEALPFIMPYKDVAAPEFRLSASDVPMFTEAQRLFIEWLNFLRTEGRV